MQRRVELKWTSTARAQLAALPPKVRKGLIAKADELIDCEDPRSAHKALVGPLAQFYRITYARYRAVYSVDEEVLANGDLCVRIRITFVAAGMRKEQDKKDIYKIAEKMVNLGLIEMPDHEDDAD